MNHGGFYLLPKLNISFVKLIDMPGSIYFYSLLGNQLDRDDRRGCNGFLNRIAKKYLFINLFGKLNVRI